MKFGNRSGVVKPLQQYRSDETFNRLGIKQLLHSRVSRSRKASITATRASTKITRGISATLSNRFTVVNVHRRRQVPMCLFIFAPSCIPCSAVFNLFGFTLVVRVLALVVTLRPALRHSLLPSVFSWPSAQTLWPNS
jgi:hypothetical protein